MVSLDRTNEAGFSLFETLADSNFSPSDEAGNKDIRRKIFEAVEMLPTEQKEVFLLRMEGDLSFKEIAAIQRVSINTALARMQYALAKLKNELKEEYRREKAE